MYGEGAAKGKLIKLTALIYLCENNIIIIYKKKKSVHTTQSHSPHTHTLKKKKTV